MKTKQILIALAVFALLSAYLYFFGIKKKADEQKAKDESSVLFPGAAKEAVTEVTLRLKSGEIALKKSGNDWDMTKPFSVPADKNMAEAVISRFIAAKADRKIEGAVLADYNLNTPPVYAEFIMSDGKANRVYMSDFTPAKTGAYAKKEGNYSEVYILPKALREDLDRPLKSFRYKGLLRHKEGGETKLIVNVEGKKYTAEKDGEDWYVTVPGPRRLAKKDRFTSIFNNMINSGAKEYYGAAEAGKYGLTAPSEYIKIYEGKTEHTVYFGKRDKEKSSVYARSSLAPGIVEAGDYIYSAISTLNEAYNKQVLVFKMDDVMEISVKYGDKSIASKRNKPGSTPDWINTEVKGISKDEAKNYRPASAMGGIFWAEYRQVIEKRLQNKDADYGFSPPQVELKMTGKGGKSIGTVLVGNKKGPEEVYVKVEGNDTLYILPESSITGMSLPGLSLN